MEQIFLQIAKMSLTAGYVILILLMARLLLKKVPKVFSYGLWSVVLFRLVCPFSFESVISLLPQKRLAESRLFEGIITASPKIPVTFEPDGAGGAGLNAPAAAGISATDPMETLLLVLTILWIVGVAAMLIYSVLSFLKLKRSLKNAVHIEGNIYQSTSLKMPFVLGIFKPKIYLPSTLCDSEKSYILKHEQRHIKRLDHLIKPFSFLALSVHWFNPLVWISFALMSKDMEMSCDEAVVKELGNSIKQDYSSSLLTLSGGRRMLSGSPLAFGESDTKARIKNVLSYKKPAFWIVIMALIVVIAVGIGLLANPKTKPDDVGYNGQDAIILKLDIENKTMLVEGLATHNVLGDQCVVDCRDANVFEVWGTDIRFISMEDLAVGDKIILNVNEVSETYPTQTTATDVQRTMSPVAEPDITNTYYEAFKLSNGKRIKSLDAAANERNFPLLEDILMQAKLKSAAFEGIDIATLDECYHIRQTFLENVETHDYYVYWPAEASPIKGNPVVQSGKDGYYSAISSELYESLVKLFDENAALEAEIGAEIKAAKKAAMEDLIAAQKTEIEAKRKAALEAAKNEQDPRTLKKLELMVELQASPLFSPESYGAINPHRVGGALEIYCKDEAAVKEAVKSIGITEPIEYSSCEYSRAELTTLYIELKQTPLFIENEDTVSLSLRDEWPQVTIAIRPETSLETEKKIFEFLDNHPLKEAIAVSVT